MRHPLRQLSVAFALAGSATAQVVVVATSAGIGVQVPAAAPATVAAGSLVTPGLALAATSWSGDGLFRAEHAVASAEVLLRWTVTSRAFPAGTAGQAVSHGAIRYELVAAQPVVGQLVVEWIPTSTGTGSAVCSVDLFDDGAVDAVAGATFPVAFGPGVLPCRVQAGCTAAGGVVYGPFGTHWNYQGAARGDLLLRFVPTHCQSTVVGAACGGTQLDVVGNLGGGADLRGTFAAGADFGVAVLGFDPSAAALPLPPACPLLVAPVAMLWQALGTGSAAVWSLALPASARPVAFRAQLVGFDAAGWQATTSDARWITCQ